MGVVVRRYIDILTIHWKKILDFHEHSFKDIPQEMS